MAIVTIELRNLLKTDFKLFDFTYQCSDMSWKTELEQAIITYYQFEEIGQETPERFKAVFKNTLQLCMPYYDKLHESYKVNIDINALNNYRITETLVDDRAHGGRDVSTSDTNVDSRSTDYPQHTNIMDDIPTGRSISEGNTENSVIFGSTDTRTYTKAVEGLKGVSTVQLIKEYRNNLIRINDMIIQELKKCFILIY